MAGSLYNHQVQIEGRKAQIKELRASLPSYNKDDRKVVKARIKFLESLVAKYEAQLAEA